MNSNGRIVAAIATLVLLAWTGTLRADPIAPSWDIVGNWDINYSVEDGIGGMSFTVNTEDLQSGAFTAWDNSRGDAFSGTVQGSAINFTDYQNDTNSFGVPFLNVLSIEGTIGPDGTMSGPMDQVNGGTDWHGSFWTVAGDATPIPSSAPLPSTALGGVILLGALGLLKFHRRT